MSFAFVGASLGYGTYFAVDASYSVYHSLTTLNHNGKKFVYVCRVLTGEYTLGREDFIEPPRIGSRQFDSVVDNVINPSMFVIFHDAQAYPEYLITLR